MEHCQSPDLIEYAALLDPFPSQEPFTKLSERWREVKEVTGELSLAEVYAFSYFLWEKFANNMRCIVTCDCACNVFNFKSFTI